MLVRQWKKIQKMPRKVDLRYRNMNIKQKVKNSYNETASLWHESRITTPENSKNEKLLKQNRPHLFVEKPAMYSKVPDLSGKDVLCLGCGSGEECEFIFSKTPKSLTGVDISKELIKIAAENFPKGIFKTMDAENLNLPNNSFDFIYCSLMLDYFEHWGKVMREIYRVLKKNGTLLFSNLHPVKWAAENTVDEDGKATGALLGFQKDPVSGDVKILGDYLNTQVHNMKWMKNLDIYFYTKSISEMFNEVTGAGLQVMDILEPKAIDAAKSVDKSYWEINQKIPNFIIFEAQKN